MKRTIQLQFVLQFISVLMPISILIFLILKLSNNHLTYSLDDPYIHLTLARNIWHGHYGINTSEFSAPSSSILWPFLLAPFSLFPDIFEYIPLIINILSVAGLAYCIDFALPELTFPKKTLLVFIVLLSLNCYGLVFTGMEHNLQLLLVALVILPFLRNQSASPAPLYQILAIILLPLVRYEGLAISVPVIYTLYAKGEKKLAISLLLALLIVMGSFSLFLYSKDLGFLPTSVFAKTTRNGLFSILGSMITNQEEYGYFLLIVSIISALLWKTHKAWAVALILATLLHSVFGKNGWFGRYENYYVIFLVLICIRVVLNYAKPLFPHILFLPFMFVGLIECTLRTPAASSDIYCQQAQTGLIAKMLDEPVAVNDLGFISYRSGNYVLDLWGLGSLEALNYRKHNVDQSWTESLTNRKPFENEDAENWIQLLMTKKQVKYAIVYDEWIPRRPANWIKVGTLQVKHKTTLIVDHLSFYATDSVTVEKFKSVLHAYAQQKSFDQIELKIDDQIY